MNLKEDDLKNRKEGLNNYIKYSTLAFEMGAIIGLGTWAGVSLDGYFSLKTPIFTIILSLFSVFGSLYFVIKKVQNDR